MAWIRRPQRRIPGDKLHGESMVLNVRGSRARPSDSIHDDSPESHSRVTRARVSALRTNVRTSLGRARPLMTAGVLGQAVALLAVPFLTRIYSEGAFGSLALLSSALAILTPISTLRFEMAVPIAVDDREAVDVASLAAGALCVVALLALAVVVAGGWAFTSFAHRQLLLIGGSLAVNMLLSGLYLVGITWLIRREAFRRIAVVNATQAVAQVIAYLLVGLALPNRVGMFVGLTIGNLVGLAALGYALRTAVDPPTIRTTGERMMAAARRFRRFAWVATPGTLLNTVAVELPFLILARVLTTASYGVLSVARRITQAPVSLLAQAVGKVFHGSTARTAREQTGRARSELKVMIAMMTSVALGALVLYIFVVPPLLTLVFDKKWHQTGRFVKYLSFVFLAQGVASATTAVVDVAERQELQLLRDAIALISTGLVGVVVLRSSVGAIGAITAFVVIGVANAGFALVISYVAARHVDRRRPILKEV